MDTRNCPTGRFTDMFFELSKVKCSEQVADWVIVLTVIIACRTLLIFESGRNWIVIHGKKLRSVKKGYWFKTRLPITPMLLALSGISALVLGLLPTFNVANFENRISFILLGLYLLFHLILGNVAFLRYVRMGLKIVPLVKNLRQTRPNSSTHAPFSSLPSSMVLGLPTTPSTADFSGELNTGSAALASILDVHGERDSLKIENDLQTETDPNRLSIESVRMKEHEPGVVANGIYSFKHQDDVSSNAKNRKERVQSDESLLANDELSRRADTSRFDTPLKLLSALQTLCSLVTSVTATFGGLFADNRDLILTLSFYFYGLAHLIQAAVYFWQLHRNIAAIRTLSSHSVISPGDVQKATKWLHRQRLIMVLSSLIYSGCAFLIASTFENRKWWLFFLGDLLVVCHQLALAILTRKPRHAENQQRKNNKKPNKAHPRENFKRDRSNVKRVFSSEHQTAAEVVISTFSSVGSSRVDLQACKLEYSIVSPK